MGIAILAGHSEALAQECTLTSKLIITIRPEPLKMDVADAKIEKNALLPERIIKVEEAEDATDKKTRYTISHKL